MPTMAKPTQGTLRRVLAEGGGRIMTLKLASKLELPNDAVTQTFLILGKRGSGKTNTAVVLAEEMIKLAPIVVLDPIDAWWGLKSSFEGDRPGLNIYVFGGRHPDLPLDPHTGELMARLFIEHRISMILSMKGWTVSDRARFVTDFVTYLLNHNNRVPVHVFLEEADAFIPQRPQPDEAKMLGATDRLIRWGRMDGIGATAISQRSAAINKNTTTQAETLIAHRTIGPQDRDAIEEWIKFHGTKEERDKILSELPHLHNGEAYIWSPEWLKLLDRYFIRRRKTFDSAATPKIGEKMITPKTLSKVDLEQISGQLQSVIDHAKQDDPKELRRQLAEANKRIIEVERAYELKAGMVVEVDRVIEVVPDEVHSILGFFIKFGREVAGHGDGAMVLVERAEELYKLPSRGAGLAQTAEQRASNSMVDGKVDGMRGKPRQASLSAVDTHSVSVTRLHDSAIVGYDLKHPDENRRAAAGSSVHPDLKFPQKRILDALAWMESIGQHGSHWTLIAMLAQQSPKSSGFANNVSVLRVNGFLDGNKAFGLALTGTGRSIAVAPDVPLTTEDLLRAIAGKITAPQMRILRCLTDKGSPTIIGWDTVARHSGQSPTSSGFANNVSVLRSMGLVRGNRSGLEAAAVVFI
jgi:uncharacterized protein